VRGGVFPMVTVSLVEPDLNCFLDGDDGHQAEEVRT
jgi:hypothetical protein